MTVKQALLLASYGTTHAEARARGIGALASEAAAAFPRRRVMEAYTSPKVRRVLQARGEGMPGPAEALRQLRAEGREDLLVQPCLVAEGKVLDALLEEVQLQTDGFARVCVGAPLIASAEDAAVVAHELCVCHAPMEGGAMVCVGHGSGARTEQAFALVAAALADEGRSDALVTTLHHSDGVEGLLHRLPSNTHTVTLVPLLLTAGSHVSCELAGAQEASWVSRLCAAGLEARCERRGLLEHAPIRALLLHHASCASHDGWGSA